MIIVIIVYIIFFFLFLWVLSIIIPIKIIGAVIIHTIYKNGTNILDVKVAEYVVTRIANTIINIANPIKIIGFNFFLFC